MTHNTPNQQADEANERSWEEIRSQATGVVPESPTADASEFEDQTRTTEPFVGGVALDEIPASSMDDAQNQDDDSNAAPTDRAKQVVKESLNEAKGQLHTAFADQKHQAAGQLNDVAAALRQTSQELHSHDKGGIAQYADSAADQVERFSGYLDGRDFGELWDDLQTMANRQPELFVAGALAAGFLAGRFLRSSGTGDSNRQSYYQQRPQYGATWSGQQAAASGQKQPTSVGEDVTTGERYAT